MKSNDSTEMERLMRRFARRSGEAAGSGGEQNGELPQANAAHLDADEVNAYAEDALPQAARSRYFAHLADCDTCRKLVTDLTLAAVKANADVERVAALVPSQRKSWREWLSAIFSPPVLRYGVPALALSAVIVVAIVATRTQRDASMVAQRDEAGRAYSPAITANSNSTATTNSQTRESNTLPGNTGTSNVRADQTPQPLAAATPTMKAPEREADSPIAPVTDVAKPAAVPTETTADERRLGELAKRVEEVTVAQSQPPPLETGITLDGTVRDKKADESQARTAGKDEDLASSKSTGGVTGTRANEPGPVAGRRAAPAAQELPSTRPAAARKQRPAAEEKAGSSELRSAGGREFRREGGAWVDTAYRSSLQTTHVARGSEHYRSLVADEPGLRAIIQQLGGEVIVVWKSRAYRFY